LATIIEAMAEPADSLPPNLARVQDRLVAALKANVSMGRLDLAVYEEAVERILRATSHEAMGAAVADLPLVELAPEGDRQGDLRIQTRVASCRRHGRWSVGAHTTIITGVGSCWLDFSDAVWDQRTIDLDIATGIGFVRLRIPPWIALEFQSVEGKVVCSFGYEAPLPGLPLMRLRANAAGGAIRIRRPRARNAN
jgi:hypothetical protein